MITHNQRVVGSERRLACPAPVAESGAGTFSTCGNDDGQILRGSFSQCREKRLVIGWIKTIADQERTKFRGCARVGWAFTFAAVAYNLARLPKLMEAA
jgi:hypothetical protein